MVRQLVRLLMNLTASTAAFPVMKLILSLLVLICSPSLGSGGQSPACGDSSGMVVQCHRLPSYVNVTCETWQIFMTGVTNPTNGKVSRAMSLVTALSGHCAPKTRETLSFYAGVTPHSFMTTPSSHTEGLQTIRVRSTLSPMTVNDRMFLTAFQTPANPHPREVLQTIRVTTTIFRTTVKDRKSLTNSPTPVTQHSHAYINRKRVNRASSVPVHTYVPVVASPLEKNFFIEQSSYLAILICHTLVMLTLFWYYIKTMEQQRGGPEVNSSDGEVEERDAAAHGMMRNDAAPGMMRDDAAPGMMRDDAAPGMMRDDAAPGMMRDDAAPGMMRDDAAPGMMRDDAAPGMMNDDHGMWNGDLQDMWNPPRNCMRDRAGNGMRNAARNGMWPFADDEVDEWMYALNRNRLLTMPAPRPLNQFFPYFARRPEAAAVRHPRLLQDYILDHNPRRPSIEGLNARLLLARFEADVARHVRVDREVNRRHR